MAVKKRPMKEGNDNTEKSYELAPDKRKLTKAQRHVLDRLFGEANDSGISVKIIDAR